MYWILNRLFTNVSSNFFLDVPYASVGILSLGICSVFYEQDRHPCSLNEFSTVIDIHSICL